MTSERNIELDGNRLPVLPAGRVARDADLVVRGIPQAPPRCHRNGLLVNTGPRILRPTGARRSTPEVALRIVAMACRRDVRNMGALGCV